jgi:hypothetical protein
MKSVEALVLWNENLPFASVVAPPRRMGSSAVASYRVTGTPARGVMVPVPPDCTVPAKMWLSMERSPRKKGREFSRTA